MVITDYQWLQKRIMKFEAPEFYEDGGVIIITTPNGRALIRAEGDAHWQHEGKNLSVRTRRGFRETFPDGKLPIGGGEDGWVCWNNRWFSVYDMDTPIESISDQVDFYLTEAIETAKNYLTEKVLLRADHLRVKEDT